MKTKGEAFQLATGRSGADTRSQKRLAEVAQELDNANGRDLPVDKFTAEVISTDEKRLRRLLASQNQAVDDAAQVGQPQQPRDVRAGPYGHRRRAAGARRA